MQGGFALGTFGVMPRKETKGKPKGGEILRHWRTLRGMSQLQLATESGASPRHVGLVESDRARPSRPMLAALAEILDIPLRERNALFRACGFAPPYSQAELKAPELAAVGRALRFVLERSEPNPCFVLDARYDALLKNTAAGRLLDWLLDPVTFASMEQPLNLARLFVSPAMRPRIVNWKAIASSFAQRLYHEATSGDAAIRALATELLGDPGMPSEWRTASLEPSGSPLVPLVLQRGALRLSFFVTVAKLGAPLAVTLQELRIETYLPADQVTELALLRMGEIRG
jgi:transcriptional regulator with XRE-family HTH domain